MDGGQATALRFPTAPFLPVLGVADGAPRDLRGGPPEALGGEFDPGDARVRREERREGRLGRSFVVKLPLAAQDQARALHRHRDAILPVSAGHGRPVAQGLDQERRKFPATWRIRAPLGAGRGRSERG